MYEYKCVGAPEKARRAKGAKTRTDRVAMAMQDLIQTEAIDGWEYLRTDMVPVEEKAGLFSRPRESRRAVLVFRREKVAARTGRSRDHLSPLPVEEPPVRLTADQGGRSD